MKRANFDPSKHEYEGGSIPSVTQILEAAGYINYSFMTEAEAAYYKLRGTYIHYGCKLYDEGTLDYNSLDPVIKPYIDAFMKYRQDCPMVPDHAEYPLANEKYGGMPDYLILQRPRNCTDIKSGDYAPWHRIQTALYVNLLPDPFSWNRNGLYLNNDGTYKLRLFPKTEYMQDRNAGLAALTTYNWKKLHGLIK